MLAILRNEAGRGAVLATTLYEHELAAPALCWSEVAHSLLRAHRRGELTEPDLRAALARWSRFEVSELRCPDGVDIVAAAERTGLSAYDATYLSTCTREHAPLATLDLKMQRAAEREGVALVTLV